MATLVLSTVGMAVGGPIGSAIGALVGSRIDKAIGGSGRRDGSRLQELRLTTSSYGSPVPRHFGKVRAPGSIIWATDLTESREKTGGGKGKPAVTSYSYSVSFAVALSSRRITDIGRIWADGNLLRGAAGDLKVGGQFRLYRGFGDQRPDPLLASACGPQCPAFRGTAYCVFEGLELAEFGNRIPALTFEIIADEGDVSLGEMIAAQDQAVSVAHDLPKLAGFTEEGGPLIRSLETISELYPFSCNASGQTVSISSTDDVTGNAVLLPPPAVDPSGDSFGASSGHSRSRQADLRDVPEGVRYYDLARDFQPGLQRADGRSIPGRNRIIEFPGALAAQDARRLANQAAERAAWGHERLSWRMAELDPGLEPGTLVRVPGRRGIWRIEAWEWRETGVELDLLRLPHGPMRTQAADAGEARAPRDLQATPTHLFAFELPWDGNGAASNRAIHAAASSESAGWKGAALFVQDGPVLKPAGSTGRQRCVMGSLSAPLPAGDPALIDRQARLEVELLAPDLVLTSASLDALANGANRALLGEELIQFAQAHHVEGRRWALSGLLRGVGGTERFAGQVHPPGTHFVLLNDAVVRIDPTMASTATHIAASGLADSEPVYAQIAPAGVGQRPLAPVHPRIVQHTSGDLWLGWTRRARGAWAWPEAVEVPLVEEAERYRVGVGDPAAPSLVWEVTAPQHLLPAAQYSVLQAQFPGQPIWVRQVGSQAQSDPLLLHILS
ncbi:phage tail protein [Altererythrobacter lauratis]|uniref:Phage tail protein n=1 Tax=Alteraurantiacibacter lauratis TaxID=2054627 RepID=A0ABV7EIJ6_9SPHN